MKIIIINPFGIGDVVFSTPLIEALKKIYPESFIGYLCNRRAYEVLRFNPHLNKIFVYEKDEYRKIWYESKFKCVKKVLSFLNVIKKEHFDIVIDLSLGHNYSLFLMLIGVRKRLGLNYRERGKFLTEKIDIAGFVDKHVVEYYLDILTLLGHDPAKFKDRPRVYISEKENVWAEEFLRVCGCKPGEKFIGVIPGCGASWGADADFRRWGREDFAKVGDALAEKHGCSVILFGDPKEVGVCEEVAKMMKSGPVMSCGKTNLGNFLSLLSRCELVVTNDGGPLHMAVGLGVKTVSIFGPVDENVYGPYPRGSKHAAVSVKGLDCRPCYKKFKYKRCDRRECLVRISSDDVIRAADKLWDETV